MKTNHLVTCQPLPEESKFPAQILQRSSGLSSVGLFSGARAPGTQLPPEKNPESALEYGQLFLLMSPL
jgi:hypothetical protein